MTVAPYVSHPAYPRGYREFACGSCNVPRGVGHRGFVVSPNNVCCGRGFVVAHNNVCMIHMQTYPRGYLRFCPACRDGGGVQTGHIGQFHNGSVTEWNAALTPSIHLLPMGHARPAAPGPSRSDLPITQQRHPRHTGLAAPRTGGRASGEDERIATGHDPAKPTNVPRTRDPYRDGNGP